MKAVLTVLFSLSTMLCFSNIQENQSDSGILELANRNRFKNPEQSLKTYNFLLKNANPEQELILNIKKLEVEILLKNYQNAIDLFFKIKESSGINSNPVLKFEFLRNTTLLYWELAFYSKMEKSFEEVNSIYENLSKENQENVLVDFQLLKFKVTPNFRVSAQSFNSILDKLSDKNEQKQWALYNFGKLYSEINTDSSKYYYRKVYNIGEKSKISTKAIFREKLLDSTQPVYFSNNSPEFSESYFQNVRKSIFLHNYNFWKTQENSDSILKYKTILQEFENQEQQTLYRAKTYFTEKTLNINLKRLKQTVKTKRKAGRYVIFSSVILVLLYIVFRIYFDYLRRKRKNF